MYQLAHFAACTVGVCVYMYCICVCVSVFFICVNAYVLITAPVAFLEEEERRLLRWAQ